MNNNTGCVPCEPKETVGSTIIETSNILADVIAIADTIEYKLYGAKPQDATDKKCESISSIEQYAETLRRMARFIKDTLIGIDQRL